jgi:toxin ParE1/3/4
VTYRVLFTPEAEDHLDQLYRYIAEAADAPVAARYVEAVIGYSEGLAEFPERGRARDDIRPGLRTTSDKKRRAIACAIREDTVVVLGIFHGGRDYEAILSEPDDGS